MRRCNVVFHLRLTNPFASFKQLMRRDGEGIDERQRLFRKFFEAHRSKGRLAFPNWGTADACTSGNSQRPTGSS